MKKIFWKTYHYGKNGMMWLVYAIFFLYISRIVFSANALGAKFVFGIIGFGVLAITIYFDYLKRLYEKMIYRLTADCNIELAEKAKQKLLQKDFVHGFRKSLQLFDALLLLDKGQYQACLNHLETHKQLFHGTIDYLFISYHTQLHCCYFLNDKEQSEYVYQKLQELKQTNPKKYRALFSWDEIDGVYYLTQERNKKSIQAFQKVNAALLNPRETTYLYYMEAQAHLALKEQQKASELLTQVHDIGHTLVIARRGNE